MHYDVGGCVICVSNKVEYLDKEELEKYIKTTNVSKDILTA